MDSYKVGHFLRHSVCTKLQQSTIDAGQVDLFLNIYYNASVLIGRITCLSSARAPNSMT